MRRPYSKNVQFVGVSVFLLLSFLLRAQDAPATHTLQIHAVLVDGELNQKAVPRLEVTLTPASGGAPVVAHTDFDGKVSIPLSAGRYRLQTSAMVFQGQSYTWKGDVEMTRDALMDLSNDNADREAAPVTSSPLPQPEPQRRVDELSVLYSRLKNSVATVWSEYGSGTGFFIDDRSMVVTNQHVIGSSKVISVQFDEHAKVAADVLVSDPAKDVAVLKIDASAFPNSVAAPLSARQGSDAVIEGERVFTIGSPLNQQKIITTGIVSKVEPRAIISDININHGNSGGPLFNSFGEVVGITTFADMDTGRPGVSGIIRLEEELPVINRARIEAARTQGPSPTLLPVEPTDRFPIDAIKAAVQGEKFDKRPYTASVGGFDIAFITPLLRYRLEFEDEMAASRQKDRRHRKAPAAVQNTFQPLEYLSNWREYIGDYKPVLHIEARPQLREGFWSAFGRGLAASQGVYAGPANLAFQTDFYRMELLCGSEVVQPIHPMKSALVMSEENYAVRVKDATYAGFYTYPADAISPACGAVMLKLYSEKTPTTPSVYSLNPKTINRVWQDFDAYRQQSTTGSSH